MKVRCITNKTANLSQVAKKHYTGSDEDSSIKPGENYCIYALTVYKQHIWYAISDNEIYYPTFKPSALFEITDNNLSRYWRVNVFETATTNFRLAFPEWIETEHFYDKLVDGEEREVEIFQKYKTLMDKEFPDSSVVDYAQIGDANWLICPDCIDAWVSDNMLDALVVCPMCRKTFNNPRYVNFTRSLSMYEKKE